MMEALSMLEGKPLWQVGIAAASVAAIANAMVFLIITVLGAEVMVAPPGSVQAIPLGVLPVILSSFVPGVAATVLLYVLGRLTPKPLKAFWAISALFLLFSFNGPISLPVGGMNKAILGLMHVVAAASIVGILTKYSDKE